MLPSYQITYSYRKTLGIRIGRDARLLVSAPLGFPEDKVHAFVQSKAKRILTKIKQKKKEIPDTHRDITREMKDHTLIQILPRIEYYANLMDVSHRYTNIKITTAQTKRGSCSSRGILMFHWKLSKFPLSIIDYVVVHELAHLIHFNHSTDFWNLVEQYHPNYKMSKKRLKDNGNGLGLG